MVQCNKLACWYYSPHLSYTQKDRRKKERKKENRREEKWIGNTPIDTPLGYMQKH